MIPIRISEAWRSERSVRLIRSHAGTSVSKSVRLSYEYDDQTLRRLLDIPEGRKLTAREQHIEDALYNHVTLNFARTTQMYLCLNKKGRPAIVAMINDANGEIVFDLEDLISDLANEFNNEGNIVGNRRELLAFRDLSVRITATLNDWLAELPSESVETPKSD